MQLKNKNIPNGFSIIELLVTIAIFAILISGVLGSLAVVGNATKAAREKTILSSLATNYLEIVRNMPYSQVGTINGNPTGQLPDQPNAYSQTINGTTYQIYYEVTYIHDPNDPIVGNPSYKQVKMDVVNTSTGLVTSFVTTVVPKGLITNPNTGALQIFVINSQGNPVAGADITITSPTTTPTIILNRISNSAGQWTEVGLPPGVNNYHIVVTEPGYSTDQTYAVTAQNPNPIHPDATVSDGQITSITFSIDQLASLNIKTLDQTCAPISGVNLNVLGAKLIGNNPNVNKFNNNYSSAGGVIALNNLEWDTYTPTLLTGQSYVTYGTSPIQEIGVLPGTSQTFTMILGSNSTPNSLLVVVKDASSSSALENATVTLTEGGNTYGPLLTGGSVWLQNDWSGGSGQAQYSSSSPGAYYADNGSIDASTPGLVQLAKLGGVYTSATGTLESSTFDTGTNATNYTILSWQPLSQSASTTLEFQVAANNDNSTWNYVGPDGTANSYFTTPGQDMGSALDGNEFFRYKAYLSTQNPAQTPVLTSVSANFVTGCFTPGQVMFSGLNAASDYSLSVSMPGYSTQNISPINVNGNQSLEVDMSP